MSLYATGNPIVKVGDKIILVRASNGQQASVGKTLEVTATNGMNFTVRDKERNINLTIYNTAPADCYILADRKARLKHVNEQIKSKRAELSDLVAEREILDKFETEEDYIAHKLNLILKAKNEKEIADVLKLLKKTHYL